MQSSNFTQQQDLRRIVQPAVFNCSSSVFKIWCPVAFSTDQARITCPVYKKYKWNTNNQNWQLHVLSKWCQGQLELFCSLTFPSLLPVLLCQTTVCSACHSSSSIWMVALEGKRNGKTYFRPTKLGEKCAWSVNVKHACSVILQVCSFKNLIAGMGYNFFPKKWLKGKDLLFSNTTMTRMLTEILYMQAQKTIIRYDIPCGLTVFANIFTKGLAYIFWFCRACFYPLSELQMNQKKESKSIKDHVLTKWHENHMIQNIECSY